jgi:Lon protease-like protein
MLPPVLPIFPLPNIVLFPNVFLPLHIFEPRYRAMVADALEDERMIGMVLLRPGWESSYEGRPPVFPIGCAGLITHHERLPDGRYNIILRGFQKFRIRSEDTSRSYRLAHVAEIDEPAEAGAQEEIRHSRRKLEALLMPHHSERGMEARIPPAMADEDLINALAQYMELEPLEKQALLEREGLLARCRSLVELLEMKMMVTNRRWSAGH